MARVAQGPKDKGSQGLLQKLVNDRPELADRHLREWLKLGGDETVQWLSPLRDDEYAEYSGEDFVARIGASLDKVRLDAFWPKSGPVWDGLARTSAGHLILVEAKAHIPELASDPTGAKGKSLAQIKGSLDKARLFYGSRSGGDWSTCFYQYANRLAHLYLLRELNKLDAYLLLICFINAKDMNGPTTSDEWLGAIRLMDAFLGVREHKVSGAVLDLFVDAGELRPAGA